MAEITILSVYHSTESKKLLEINRDLTEKLNPGAGSEWILADNTPADFPGKLTEKDGFTVVPGLMSAPDNVPDWIKPSFHHNVAMNNSIKYAKTRFLLFLDSDFYMLRPNCISEVIEYMKKNNLAFFGSPWHPKQYKKFRYFPAHQCLFVDTEKINKNDLDFTPMEYHEEKNPPPKKHIFFISRFLNTFDFANRRTIGAEKHTAHRLFEKFAGDPNIKSECVVSVLKPSQDSYPAAKLWYGLNRVLEFLLPDGLCYVPKDRSYWTSRGFRELGFCNAFKYGWEEYIWKNEPFGLHVRPIKQIKKGLSLEEIILKLKECLSSFSKRAD